MRLVKQLRYGSDEDKQSDAKRQEILEYMMARQRLVDRGELRTRKVELEGQLFEFVESSERDDPPRESEKTESKKRGSSKRKVR